MPFYPVTPLLFIVSAAALVLNTFIAQSGRVLIGLGVVLLAVPVDFLWRSS